MLVRSRRRLKPALGVAVVLACLTASSSAATQAPRACALLTKSVAAALIDESPKTLVDQPLVCSYGRSSERAATLRTTISLLLVRNPSVAAAKKVQRATENAAPKKASGGLEGFVRTKIRVPGADDAFFVYFYLPGTSGRPTGTNGLGFLRVGAYTVQLTFDLSSKGAPAFTADDLRRSMADVAARWPKRG
jgi:hypothetical protein